MTYHATEITPISFQKANWLPLSYMYKKAILKHVHQAFYQAGPAQISRIVFCERHKVWLSTIQTTGTGQTQKGNRQTFSSTQRNYDLELDS